MPKDYGTIDNPYDSSMVRETSPFFSAEGDAAAQASETAPGGGGDSQTNSNAPRQNNENIWLAGWMKSLNYKPGQTGFLIDGQQGLIECIKLISNNAELAGRFAGTTMWTPTASTTLRASADAEETFAGAGMTLVKEITIGAGIYPGTGSMRISFDLMNDDPLKTKSGRVYQNGAPVGILQTTTLDGVYETFTEDIAGWAAGDLIQLYVQTDGTGGAGSVQNFRVYYDRTQVEELTVTNP